MGDRMDISFIGILTVVAYQIMFSADLPKVAYLTILMSFMIISFLTMSANVRQCCGQFDSGGPG